MSSRSSRAVTAALLVFTLVFTLFFTLACRTTSQSSPRAAAPAARAASNTQLQHDLGGILTRDTLAHGTWSVVVKSMTSGATLYSTNAQRLLMPASTMKMVTLATAAEHLGWNFTYETRLSAIGSIENGVLRGDLVVTGSGDPSIGTADQSADHLFDEWSAQLRRLGIRAIDGRLVGDDRAFERETLGFGWSWDDLAIDYAAGVSALQFNENAVRVTIAHGAAAGDSAAMTVDPPTSELTVVNHVTTGKTGSPRALDARRLPGAQRLEISGSIATDSDPAVLNVSVDNPTRFFVSALRRGLIARGIDARGDAVDVHELSTPPAIGDGRLVATHQSPPLSTLAIRLMKASQNQYAETLLKTIGRNADGAPASASAGSAEVRNTFTRWNIDPNGLVQRDGSGLSRYDYLNADTLVSVLDRVYHDATLYQPFRASLPVAGVDGTLARRFKDTRAEGRVHAKTGSMSNVRTLAGYVDTEGGDVLAFAILANNFDVTAPVVEAAVDIVERLVRVER